MEILNAQEAYTYLDGLTDDRERSAALAIHLAYMDHCSSSVGANRIVASTPLDMAILYRATVAAFRLSAVEASGPTSSVARVVNREQAERRLTSISDGRHLALASRFVSEVDGLADGSPCEQDLLFFLGLFLRALERCTPEAIESGEISRASRRLEDTDYW